MSKLAVLFIFGFIFVQCASAGVVKRDTNPPSDAPKNLEDALLQMQNFLKSAFSQEQMDKLSQEMKQFGDVLSAKGKEFVDDASNSLNKLRESQ